MKPRLARSPGKSTRRAMLRHLGACAAALAASPLAAQTPPLGTQRVKGPRVFLDLDQAELDAAYDQSVWAPNQSEVAKRRVASSEAARRRLGEPTRLSYGPTPIESLDLYPAKQAGAPIMIFIHGGAWRAGRARDFAFPAEVFVDAGAHFIAPDFVAVQDAGGRLTVMADQVRRAVAWVARNASGFAGDADRIFLSGHSSGAHLAGVVLTTDWEHDFSLPAGTIKGGLCCSGMFDLRGPRLSARSSYVRFDDPTEEALSPQRHLDKIRCPVTLAYGSLESPEFQRQSKDFAAALRQAAKPVQLLVGEGYNHFEMLETLGNPYGLLGRAALQLMHLRAG